MLFTSNQFISWNRIIGQRLFFGPSGRTPSLFLGFEVVIAFFLSKFDNDFTDNLFFEISGGAIPVLNTLKSPMQMQALTKITTLIGGSNLNRSTNSKPLSH